MTVDEQPWVVDAPNILAVPKAMLREHRGRLGSADPLRVQSAIDFMLRVLLTAAVVRRLGRQSVRMADNHCT